LLRWPLLLQFLLPVLVPCCLGLLLPAGLHDERRAFQMLLTLLTRASGLLGQVRLWGALFSPAVTTWVATGACVVS
jgi:hypothetical protein